MRVQAEDDHARWPRLARRTDPRHLRKRRMIDIGFIGLGTMGRPMAGHLLAAGHRVFLHDVAPVAAELISAGGTACKSAKEVAEEADAVIIMVPDTPHVEAVLFGKDGVASGI